VLASLALSLAVVIAAVVVARRRISSAAAPISFACPARPLSVEPGWRVGVGR
jgi:hypothetical protein